MGSPRSLPAGQTHHVLLLAGEDHAFSVVEEFEGSTEQFDVLIHVPEATIAARYIRVETVSSPSWVAWPEIRVYA